MYTGYAIKDRQVWGPEGETPYFVNGKHIYALPKEPTGFFLTQGNCEGVEHIYGPDGYTKYYVQTGYVYGPGPTLPWEACERESLDAVSPSV